MTPAPAVQAYCYIPRVNHGEWVHFLIDTGASETCLNGIYALGLQHHMRPETLEESHGIGGNCDYFHERTILVFRDDRNQWLSRVVWLGIQHITRAHLNNPNILHCPALLGRDILNRSRLDYNPNQREVTLIFR